MFGAGSPMTITFSAITYRASGAIMTHPMTYAQDMPRRSMGAFQSGLDAAEGILRSATDQLQRYGLEQLQAASRVRADGAKIFISHGRQTPALARIERYVRALGLIPIIVVHGASEGMSVDTLVETRMIECSCAIILVTVDDQVDSYRQPRPNVIHEIGLAQEKLNKRIIYLKEEGYDFPSNVRPKVGRTLLKRILNPHSRTSRRS